MKTFFIAALATLVAMLPIDLLWIVGIAKSFYGRQIGHLMGESAQLLPAAFFYLIYACAVALLVVMPAVAGGWSLGKVYLYGMVLGLAAYGAYDLTNQATLRDWPVVMTAVDMAWGAFVTGLVATIATMLTRYFS